MAQLLHLHVSLPTTTWRRLTAFDYALLWTTLHNCWFLALTLETNVIVSLRLWTIEWNHPRDEKTKEISLKDKYTAWVALHIDFSRTVQNKTEIITYYAVILWRHPVVIFAQYNVHRSPIYSQIDVAENYDFIFQYSMNLKSTKLVDDTVPS